MSQPVGRTTLLLLVAAAICVATGVGQLWTAAGEMATWTRALGAVLVSGGGLLVLWMGRQIAADLRLGGPAMWRTLVPGPDAAGVYLAAAVAGWWLGRMVYAEEGVLPWSRLDLADPIAWAEPGMRSYHAPVATMLAGSTLVALGVVAVMGLVGGVWVGLRLTERGRGGRAALTASLLVLGAVPFLVPLLASRLWLGGPALAASAAAVGMPLHIGQTLCGGGGVAAGLLVSCAFLGLRGGGALCSALDGIEAMEGADIYRTARSSGLSHVSAVLRRLVWQENRGAVEGVFVHAAASAVLVDLLANNLFDIFADRSVLAPLYPSLGSVTWLGLYADPAALDRVWWAHLLVALMVVALLLPLPVGGGGPARIVDGEVWRGGVRILRDLPSPSSWAASGMIHWVLGPSGAGKTTWLSAAGAELGAGAVIVPQDPDHALPRELSVAAIARWAFGDEVEGIRRVLPILLDMGDGQLSWRLADAFTPVGVFSRGQRQRLAVALGLAGARGRVLLLDEATSAQDGARTRAVLQAVRRWTDQGGTCWLCTHDPGALKEELLLDDVVCFVDDQRVVASPGGGFSAVGPDSADRRAPYVAALRELFEAQEVPALPALRRSPVGLPGGVARRGACEVKVIGGELNFPLGGIVLFEGASGAGKSVLMERLVDLGLRMSRVGWIAQDPGRACPAAMPALEARGGRGGASLFPDLAPDRLAGRLFGSLSEGQRQRLVVEAALRRVGGGEPGRLALLLLDEPFGSVDPPTHVDLVRRVIHWAGGGEHRCAVIVSHYGDYIRARAAASGIPVVRWRLRSEIVSASSRGGGGS